MMLSVGLIFPWAEIAFLIILVRLPSCSQRALVSFSKAVYLLSLSTKSFFTSLGFL